MESHIFNSYAIFQYGGKFLNVLEKTSFIF